MIASDIDGTLLDYNYIPGQLPSVNWPLLRQIAGRTDRLTLVSNQGGLPWGALGEQRKDGRAYPRPDDFVGRLLALSGALLMAGIKPAMVLACIYHPKAPEHAVLRAAYDVDALLRDAGLATPAYIYSDEKFRQPSPAMLKLAAASCYYGDSDEDEAAAQAAGIEFVRVERFFGGAHEH